MKKRGLYIALVSALLLSLCNISASALTINTTTSATGYSAYIQYQANTPENAVATGIPEEPINYTIWVRVSTSGIGSSREYYIRVENYPPDPTCLGYNFGGWHFDSACTEKCSNMWVKRGTPLATLRQYTETTPLSLYAKWTEHDHTLADAVRENEVPATCAVKGSYDSVIYCSVCSAELNRTTTPIDKLTTHTYTDYRDAYCNVCGHMDPLSLSISIKKTESGRQMWLSFSKMVDVHDTRIIIGEFNKYGKLTDVIFFDDEQLTPMLTNIGTEIFLKENMEYKLMLLNSLYVPLLPVTQIK